MKIILKIFLFLVSVTALLILTTFSVSAKSVYDIECVNAEYAVSIYFYSYDAKTVLCSKNQDKIVFPASTVKIMSGLIACERLNSRLDESVIISKDMLVYNHLFHNWQCSS